MWIICIIIVIIIAQDTTDVITMDYKNSTEWDMMDVTTKSAPIKVGRLNII